MGIQGYTWVYKGIHGYIGVYKGIHGYIRVYTARKNVFTPNLHRANIMQTYIYSRANL